MAKRKSVRKETTIPIDNTDLAQKIHLKSYESLNIKRLRSGEIHRISIDIQKNPLGINWRVPVLVAKGVEDGPVLGITAALHGNELNGLPTIFKLFKDLDVSKIKGTLVAVPVVNVPGFLAKQREFTDKKDLNRIFPGKEYGTASEMYCHNLVTRLISKFDYLLDLHTASFGRINSLYVRADLDNPVTRKMALLQNPQIIVNKYDEQGTLRAWANGQGIPCITIEIGNPHSFQPDLIDQTYEGIRNLMRYLKMLPGKHKIIKHAVTVCEKSYWVYAYNGGVIQVFAQLTDRVEKDQVIGVVYDMHGTITDKIIAPEAGYVIGRNVNPVCEAGTRVLHLGIEAKDISLEV
jgi:uncharacterized protein